MASENPLPDSALPVKVDVPDLSAPPTLAEPASGPAAEMSGALAAAPSEDKPETEAPKSDVNGATESAQAPAAADAPAQPPAAEYPSIAAHTDPAASSTTKADEAAEVTKEEPASAAKTDDVPANINGDADGKQSSKRKSSGIPEHKGKKLNKKKSLAKITHLDAKPGDHFFARLRSYPPWPSVICDEDMLPSSLLTTRPVTAMKDDGTYNEAYADGGKKANERTYPIMFLYTNEFAWIPNTDLGDLDPEYCKDVPEKGKSKSLLAAYEIAAEKHDIEFFKTMLTEHANAMAEDEARKQEEAEAKAEAKAAKAKDKKKRKSDAKAKPAADEDEDVEMEDGGEDAPEPKKSSKKRKKVAETDDEEPEKPAKTPKTTKLKLTTGKTPTTTEKKQKEKPAKAKSEKRKSKSAPVDNDEEMADAPEEEPPKPLDPVAEKKAREKEVLFLRHKLQKGFLARDQAPLSEDMPQMSQYVKKLEDYEELEVSIIRVTKINKVLKALVKLNTIPRDEEFAFRKRSVDLLAKWNKALGAEPQDGEGATEEKETAKSTPATNGVHEDSADKKEEPTPAQETSTDAKPAETPAEPMEVDKKPETAPEAEKAEEAPATTDEPKTEAAPAGDEKSSVLIDQPATKVGTTEGAESAQAAE